MATRAVGAGIFTPDEVGPMDVQVPNGVVDFAVKDEKEAMTLLYNVKMNFSNYLTRATSKIYEEKVKPVLIKKMN